MDKLVTLIVLILVVIIVIAVLTGWKSDRDPPISRFPTSRHLVSVSEQANFISQTVPTSIFSLYQTLSDSFSRRYGVEFGYKFADDVLTWEFYITGEGVNVEEFVAYCDGLCSNGFYFVLPNMNREQRIFAISMAITEDTYSNEAVTELDVHVDIGENTKYVYTLKPSGVFSFRGETSYEIRSEGMSQLMKVARQAAYAGFDSTDAHNIMKWVFEKGWNGRSYVFVKRGNQLGLSVLNPDVKTVKSYFKLRDSNLGSTRDSMLETITEIEVFFQDEVSDAGIVSDGFYIKI